MLNTGWHGKGHLKGKLSFHKKTHLSTFFIKTCNFEVFDWKASSYSLIVTENDFLDFCLFQFSRKGTYLSRLYLLCLKMW